MKTKNSISQILLVLSCLCGKKTFHCSNRKNYLEGVQQEDILREIFSRFNKRKKNEKNSFVN